MKINHYLLGEIDLSSEKFLEGEYFEVIINGRQSNLFVNVVFDFKSKPDLEHFKTLETILNKIEDFDKIARNQLLLEFESGNKLIADFIVDYHINECIYDEMKEALNLEVIDEYIFLKNLDLVTTSIYFEKNQINLCWDYMICHGDFSDQILAVKFNQDGIIKNISHES